MVVVLKALPTCSGVCRAVLSVGDCGSAHEVLNLPSDNSMLEHVFVPRQVHGRMSSTKDIFQPIARCVW